MRTPFFFILLAFSLSADLAKSQADRLGASSIDTIAGGESTNVPGRDFSALPVSGLAADSQGNIYFSIQSKSQVFRLSTGGQVTLFAGNGARRRPIDGVSAAGSPLLNPRSLAVDRAGDVYIACDSALVRVDARTKTLSTVLETPYSLPGSPGAIGEINEMVVGPDGNLYFSDNKDWRIKSYSFTSAAVTILAGNGTLGPAQVGLPAISSPLKYPHSVAVGQDGTVYFSTLEPCLFRIAPNDGKLQAISIGSPEQKALLGEYDIPSSIGLDEQGHLFVAQANRSRVLQVTLQHGDVTIYAGTGQQEFNGDGIPADQAALSGPRFVVYVQSGNLIVAENHRIRSVDSSTRLISTRVGNGGSIIDDPSTLAFHVKLWEPAYAAAAPDGSLYITSSFSNRLLRRDRNGDLVSAAGAEVLLAWVRSLA